jgi:hypothetical protein
MTRRDTQQPTGATVAHPLHAHGGPAREISTLSQQVRDRELTQRLDRRLVRCQFPNVVLQSLHCTQVAIRHHLTGRVVIDFLPSGRTNPLQNDARTTARREHMKRLQLLGARLAWPMTVVSDVPEALDLADPYFDPGGMTLCDPELLIADALGLPTVEDDARRYRTLSLIVERGSIQKVILSAETNLEDQTRRIVAWMHAIGW